jgi:hypothetical protein
MKHSPDFLPEEKGTETAYREAFESAAGQLLRNSDWKDMCLKSGARLVPNQGNIQAILVDYLGHTCKILLPGLEFGSENDNLFSHRDRLIILHYLNTSKGTPLNNKLISFQQLPEGSVYYPTFINRSIKPLLDNLAANPVRLFAAAGQLGGKPSQEGEFSVKINALPRVPLIFILWQGDEDLPPAGNILFDMTVTDYLPTEDITVLCEITAWKLVRLASQPGLKL